MPDAVFGSITGELDRLRREGDEVLLAGDFNARTAATPDVPEVHGTETHSFLGVPRENIDVGIAGTALVVD